MKTSDQIDAIAVALSKAQGEIKPAAKDSTNPHFKTKFTSLSSVWESIREPLSKNGLSALQNVSTNETHVSVSTRVLHASGQWIEFGALCIPLSKKDAQGIGSAITYGKRYSLCAALGIVSDEDDDGNAACKETKEEPSRMTTQEALRQVYADGEKLLSIQAMLSRFVNPEEITKKLLIRAGIKSINELPVNKINGCLMWLESEHKAQVESELRTK